MPLELATKAEMEAELEVWRHNARRRVLHTKEMWDRELMRLRESAEDGFLGQERLAERSAELSRRYYEELCRAHDVLVDLELTVVRDGYYERMALPSAGRSYQDILHESLRKAGRDAA